MRKILTSAPFNLVINNVFWAGCVIGRYEYIWLVLPAIVCYVILLVRERVLSLTQIALPVMLGIVIDWLFTVSGIFQFEHHRLLLPLWMCGLWLAFSTTLSLSLRPLGFNKLIAGLTGAVGFPFAYYVGFQLGAIGFGLPLAQVMILMAGIWAVLLPAMFGWVFQHEGNNHATA